MSGWLYLIRNRDLYKIGITKNFKKRMKQLKPDNIVTKLYTSEYVKLEKELHNRYKKYRIPQTEYFRLKDFHLKEIKQRILKLEYPINSIILIFIKSLLLIMLIFFLTTLFISLNINDPNTIILNSIFYMERISYGLSFISLFAHSGKYFSFKNEIKYRISRLFVFILFAFLFRNSSLFFS